MGIVFYMVVFFSLVSVNYSRQSKQGNGVQLNDDCHNGIGVSGGSGCNGGNSGNSGGSGGSGQCPTIDVLLKTCCKSGKDGQDGRNGRDGQKGDKGDKGDRGPPGSSGKCNCTIKQEDIDALQQKYNLMEQSFNAKIKEMELKLNGTSTMGFFEQVVAIKGRGASLEAFQIKGVQYLVLTTTMSHPQVYTITNSTLHLNQSLPVYGAYTIRHFQMNGNHFLAIAKRYYGSSFLQYSAIHKWDGQGWPLFQRISTKGAGEISYFTIQDQKFLCIANSHDGQTYALDSLIYKWDGRIFAHDQNLQTEGAIACSAFSIDREHFVSFASKSPHSNSLVFKWSGKAFKKFQAIRTDHAVDVHHFSIQGLHFLAFINETRYSYHSKLGILRWSNSKFVPFQTIKNSDAVSLRSLKVNNDLFLVVASLSLTYASDRSVAIYKANGNEFKFYQTLKSVKVSDVATFNHEGKTYLAASTVSSAVDGHLYEWVS